jgi:hypothetical protein
VPAAARRVLEIRQALGKSSTGKFAAMLNRAQGDGRCRSLLMYHGAGTGRWCLTGDHEVLTPLGWERLDAWGGGKIACWDHGSEVVSFQRSEPVGFPYTGPLVALKNKRFDQLSTPDHRMPCWSAHNFSAQVKPAGAIGRVQLPYTGMQRIQTSRGDDPSLRFLVMLQADGHFTGCGAVRFHFRKKRKIARCRWIFRQCQFTPTEKRNRDGTVTISLPAGRVPAWVHSFRDKTFGPWLMNANLGVLFDELERWDAYRAGPNSLQYATTNQANAEWVQTCAHISGRAALITTRESKESNWAACHYVSIWLTPSNRMEYRGARGQIPFAGSVYCAETPTGFFLVRRNGKIWVTGNSAKSIQPQNMPRDSYSGDDLDQILGLFRNRDHVGIMNTFDDPFVAASRCVRGCIAAPPGRELIAADFSSIEARANAWLAGQENILEEFRAGRDLYKVAAVDIFGVPYEEIDKDQRAVGKVSELALGYGGGIGAYASMARGYGVDLEVLPGIIFEPGYLERLARELGPNWRTEPPDEDSDVRVPQEVSTSRTFLSNNPGSMSMDAALACDLIKQRWRRKRPRIVELWKGLGGAAEGAVKNPGTVFRYNGIGYTTWDDVYRNRYLLCQLPSGRLLYYFDPQIRNAVTPWGSTRAVLTCMTVDGKTKQWARRKTLGALLCENAVQALCRDLMAYSLPALEAAGYPVVLHVHDEIASEVVENFGSVQQYETIMATVPPWAAGIPLSAEGWRGRRFRKG